MHKGSIFKSTSTFILLLVLSHSDKQYDLRVYMQYVSYYPCTKEEIVPEMSKYRPRTQSCNDI